MSFYSPYSKYPDYGQGISDIVTQFIQMMMMKKYMGQGGKTTTQNAVQQLPQQGQSARMGAGMMTPPAAGVMDPQMLAKLAQALGIDLTQILGR